MYAGELRTVYSYLPFYSVLPMSQNIRTFEFGLSQAILSLTKFIEKDNFYDSGQESLGPL